MAEANPVRLHMERHKCKLVDIIDSEFGLLNILLKNRILSDNEIGRIKAEYSRYKKNEMLLDFITRTEKHEEFMAALKESSQTHIVNWIIADGKYADELGLHWPLTDRETNILIDNQAELVKLLDTCYLLDRLLRERVINDWHKAFIVAKPIDYDRNEALLDIVRRLSREHYCKLIKCLRDSNQGHIADIFENGGAIVPVHATFEGNNLSEAETQIVNAMTEFLRQNTSSNEQANRLITGLQLNIIGVKRGNSIVLFIGCSKEEDFNHLCKVVDYMEMKETLEKLFKLLLPSLKTKVMAVTIFERDIAKAKETFAQSSKLFNSKVFVFGIGDGVSISKDVIKINLNRSENVSKPQKAPVEMIRGSAAAVHCDSVFVTGIGEKCDEIWRLDATFSMWRKCASMVPGRRFHSIAFVDQVLYICGGWVSSEKKALDDVEAYDIQKDQYIAVGKLVRAEYGLNNCAPFKSSLYIFGGIDANYEIVNKVQVYDTKLNTCTLLSEPMPRAQGLLRAVLWGNTVILLGYDCCLTYNFETGVWEVRDRFKADVYHFGSVISNGLLFVIGGGEINEDADGNKRYSVRNDVRCIPVVNILKNEPTDWRHYATLPKPSLVAAFGKMDFVLK